MLPLEGIKIIDLTRILSGPFCTMTLADLGAEVIKIESPKGDDTREWGPPFVGEESAYFLSVNRNKKSLVLNLKKDKGREVFFTLLKEADVVVENFRPGTLKRLGISYETLKERNPQVILASISGFGQTGPYSQKPGYDVLAQGMGGLMSVTGEPGRPPVKGGYSLADIGTGMWAAIGILAALREREKSGEGQWVDTSLLDTMVSWQTYLAGNYFATGKNPEPLGGAHPNIVPYQVFSASNGYFILAVGNDQLWKRFIESMEMDILKESRFATNADRVRNRNELILVLEETFKQRPLKEWVKRFEEIEIPCGPVNRFSDILNDPHIKERDMVVESDHPTIGHFKTLGLPVKLSRTTGKDLSVPPALGEHSESILKNLGYNNEDIASLNKDGITR
ncbi:MAG TPA: CoA transferase [Bacillales bacterium]|nr:CoA transferase [Bacillales bacterium]